MFDCLWRRGGMFTRRLGFLGTKAVFQATELADGAAVLGAPPGIRLTKHVISPVAWRSVRSRAPRDMAWSCHGRTNSEMVQRLKDAKIVVSPAVQQALLAVDRGFFCKQGSAAYQDAPQSIGHGATISAPHMHAFCLELLRDHLKPGARALDVGSGTGYLTAVFAAMVCPAAGGGGQQQQQGGSDAVCSGLAVGVEHIPELVAESVSNVGRLEWAAPLLASGRLTLVEGDGRLGYAEGGPWDCIHVGAAAPEVPEPLLAQLSPGGRLVIPVGREHGSQALMVIDKRADGSVAPPRREMGVVYIPLTSRQHQMSRAAGK